MLPALNRNSPTLVAPGSWGNANIFAVAAGDQHTVVVVGVHLLLAGKHRPARPPPLLCAWANSQRDGQGMRMAARLPH
jgi:hypothetical protein